jgi:predicted dehydrogenase
MAREHARQMLKQMATTEIVAVCEPSPSAYAEMAKEFSAAGITTPPNQPDLARLLRDYALDATFIITPHALHHDQTIACLEGGVDVLLEKPMVVSVAEAQSLIEARDRTGRLLVVAFPGSLSPQIRTATWMLRSGELGRVLTISGLVWQDWGALAAGTWRQQPELSGGGFLFDTGAHLLNTVSDLAGEAFAEVAAWMQSPERPVETLAVVIGRLASGALVTLHACGEAIPSCDSDVRVFCEQAILTTGIWGERLAVQYAGRTRARSIPVPPSLGVWETFVKIRAGTLPNLCPPETGLRMARLWDALTRSATNGGAPVEVEQG